MLKLTSDESPLRIWDPHDTSLLCKAHEEDWLFVRSRKTSPVEHDTAGGSLLLALPLLVIGLAWFLFYAARGGVSRGWRLLRVKWHGLVLVLVLGGALSGCETMEREVARLHGIKVDPLPGPCAPESDQAGQCVKVKQEGARP